MISKHELIVGTKDELLDYYSFVSVGGECRPIMEHSIESQLSKIEDQVNRFGYIHYIREVVKDELHIMQDGVVIRKKL